MKTCTKCAVTKPLSEFPARSEANGYRGHRARCNACEYVRVQAWRAARKETVTAYNRAWNERHLEKRREVRRNWASRNRPNRTVAEKLHDNIRAKVWAQLKGHKGRRSTFALLGYTPEALVAHLEAQFVDGMDWTNYGEWEIDHIKPRRLFSVTSADDPALRECWALSNLQPLWAKDNRSKSGKWSEARV